MPQRTCFVDDALHFASNLLKSYFFVPCFNVLRLSVSFVVLLFVIMSNRAVRTITSITNISEACVYVKEMVCVDMCQSSEVVRGLSISLLCHNYFLHTANKSWKTNSVDASVLNLMTPTSRKLYNFYSGYTKTCQLRYKQIKISSPVISLTVSTFTFAFMWNSPCVYVCMFPPSLSPENLTAEDGPVWQFW